MRVLVDTNVWSLALRRKTENEVSHKLKELLLSYQVVMIGPIRQELLSGISKADEFNKLRSKLEAYSDFPISTPQEVTHGQICNRMA